MKKTSIAFDWRGLKYIGPFIQSFFLTASTRDIVYALYLYSISILIFYFYTSIYVGHSATKKTAKEASRSTALAYILSLVAFVLGIISIVVIVCIFALDVV